MTNHELAVHTVTTCEEWMKLQPVWNTLLSHSEANVPFLTFEWLTTWWRCFARDEQLYILVARRGNEIVGIAPLMKSRFRYHGVALRSITFMANEHSHKPDFIIPDAHTEVLKAFLAHMFDQRGDFDVIHLHSFRADSSTDRALAVLTPAMQLLTLRVRSMQSPYLVIYQPWQEYLESRSRNFRKSLAKVRRNMESAGRVEAVMCTAEQVDSFIDDMLSVSCKTWKYDEKSAIASAEERKCFYATFARIAAAQGMLHLWLLKLNGTPIAFAYNLAANGTIYSLKTGYDKRYADVSPSTYLDICILNNAFESQYTEHDWLGECEPYKARWTDTTRRYDSMLMFSTTLRGRAARFMMRRVVPIIKKMRSTLRRLPGIPDGGTQPG